MKLELWCIPRVACKSAAVGMLVLAGTSTVLALPGTTNLSLLPGVTATATGADFGASISDAIDGNRDGNFGDGSIQSFDPLTGGYLGTLQDANGNPINISGLWGLQFGNGHNGGDANTLYFAAGIANGGKVEDHGLLGSIQVAQ